MILKRLIPLLCFLLYVSNAFSQRRNVYFLKNSGEYVKLLDSADFIRVVSEPDSGSQLYNIHDYYKNKIPKLVGKSSQIEPVRLEGQSITYYPSGKKKEYGNYKEGRLDGDVYTYFPNGILYAYQIYKQKKTDIGSGNDSDCITLASNDSTGKELVVNGNGYFIGYSSDFKDVIDEGNLKDGKNDGKWKGGNGVKDGYVTYTEEYRDGKMITGQSVDKQGNTHNYTIRLVEPEFKGGIQKFYEFIGNNTIYPEEARQKFITGKVLLSFVVEKDGSLSDLKVTKNPNDLLSDEAIRVLKKSPKWTPGVLYGRIARVNYTIPVNFTLSSQ